MKQPSATTFLVVSYAEWNVSRAFAKSDVVPSVMKRPIKVNQVDSQVSLLIR